MVSAPEAGKLYMVSTPIGHLGDFSFRGVEVLKAVSVIACEDTRHTRRLLTHYGIGAPLVSIHAHSSEEQLTRLLDRITNGDDVAYVTDAGTPAISDPGGRLAEQAHARGIVVVPIPGPSAVMAALAAGRLSGRPVRLRGLPAQEGDCAHPAARAHAGQRHHDGLLRGPGADGRVASCIDRAVRNGTAGRGRAGIDQVVRGDQARNVG